MGAVVPFLGLPGKEKLFEHGKTYLMAGSDAVSHAQAAQDLGMDAGAVRVAVHRLRGRYRELLRE